MYWIQSTYNDKADATYKDIVFFFLVSFFSPYPSGLCTNEAIWLNIWCISTENSQLIVKKRRQMASQDLVNIVLDNALMLDGTLALPEPILTNYQRLSGGIYTTGQFTGNAQDSNPSYKFENH